MIRNGYFPLRPRGRLPYCKRYRGFTLIEMSIVLVIIGLIVGGILVGRDLIHLAEIRGTVAQFEQFNSAVNTFRNKYNCLPGDCINAGGIDSFGLEAASNGDGNGIIGYQVTTCAPNCTVQSNATRHEYIDFWHHLSAAGLIHYSLHPYASLTSWPAGTATPPAKIIAYNSTLSFGWAIQADLQFASNGGEVMPPHNLLLTSNAMDIAVAIPRGGYLPFDIWKVDQKLDDGYPYTGIARGWTIVQSYVYTVTTFGVGSPCVVSMQYNIQYVGTALSGLCGLSMKASF